MTQQPRFCTNCGGPLVAGARFCVTCGNLVAPVPPAAPPPAEPAPSAPPPVALPEEPPAAAAPPTEPTATPAPTPVAPPPPQPFAVPVEQPPVPPPPPYYTPVQYAPPPPPPPAALPSFMPEQLTPAPAPKKKGSRRGCMLLGCGGAIVLLAVGGFAAYSYVTGGLAAFGLGPQLLGLPTAVPAASSTPTRPMQVTVAPPPATATVPAATRTPTTAPTVTRTPTATMTPTATPVVVTYQKGSQVYLETFSTGAPDWPLSTDSNMKRFVQDGRYTLQAIPPRLVGWECPRKPITVTDFVLEVSVRLEDGPTSNAYAVHFRQIDSNNFYRLQISPAGRWEFGRQLKGAYTSLVPWKSSTAIPQSLGSITVRVVGKGGAFAFFVNGAQLGAVADPSFATGNVCLAVNTLGDGGGRFSFDDLTVWEVAK